MDLASATRSELVLPAAAPVCTGTGTQKTGERQLYQAGGPNSGTSGHSLGRRVPGTQVWREATRPELVDLTSVHGFGRRSAGRKIWRETARSERWHPPVCTAPGAVHVETAQPAIYRDRMSTLDVPLKTSCAPRLVATSVLRVVFQKMRNLLELLRCKTINTLQLSGSLPYSSHFGVQRAMNLDQTEVVH